MLTLPYKITINGKSKPISIPSGWREISVKQAIAFGNYTKGDEIHLLSMFTQIDAGLVSKLPNSKIITLLELILSLYTEDMPDFKALERPPYLKLRGKEINTDIPASEIPQSSLKALKSIVDGIEASEKNETIYHEAYPGIIAYAVADRFSNRPGKQLIEELSAEIAKLSAIEVFPVGGFLIKKLIIQFYKETKIALAHKLARKNII